MNEFHKYILKAIFYYRIIWEYPDRPTWIRWGSATIVFSWVIYLIYFLENNVPETNLFIAQYITVPILAFITLMFLIKEELEHLESKKEKNKL
jgi:hypothetical protein